MKRFWRFAGLAMALTALVGGSLLMMGHQRSMTDDYTRQEFVKLRALAGHWELRLNAVYSSFNDAILRYDAESMLDHPEEWSSWRVQSKFNDMLKSWINEYGTPKTIALMTGVHHTHTVAGDTTGFARIASTMKNQASMDIVLIGDTPENPGFLAVKYQPPSGEHSETPGWLVVCFDPPAVLNLPDDIPQAWALMSGPERTLFASSQTSAGRISGPVWKLLVSEKSGVVTQPDGSSLGFCRVHVPGMKNMLLVSEIRSTVHAVIWIPVLLLSAGFGFMLFSWPRKILRPASVSSLPHEEILTDKKKEAPGYRQIFGALPDPVCVIDSHGAVTRANRPARELLRVGKGGKPDPAINVSAAGTRVTGIEFLKRVGKETSFCRGSIVISDDLGTVFSGAVEAVRLFLNEDGDGPALVSFKALPETGALKASPQTEIRNTLDPANPFPILDLDKNGRIAAAGKAAERSSSVPVKESLATDILPGLNAATLRTILIDKQEAVFESPYGNQPYKFHAVPVGKQMRLYGFPMQETEPSRKNPQQGRENLKTLMSMTPLPVLIVNPKDRTVVESNDQANRLFKTDPDQSKSILLDSMTAEPFSLKPGTKTLTLQTNGGQGTPFVARCEAVTIKDKPHYLILLEPQETTRDDGTESACDEPVLMISASGKDYTDDLPPGPGLVVAENETVREVTERLLSAAGQTAESFADPESARQWLASHRVRPRFITIDTTDSEASSQWLSHLQKQYGEVPCLFLTNGNRTQLPKGNGNSCLISKPFDLHQIRQALQHIRII